MVIGEELQEGWEVFKQVHLVPGMMCHDFLSVWIFNYPWKIFFAHFWLDKQPQVNLFFSRRLYVILDPLLTMWIKQNALKV